MEGSCLESSLAIFCLQPGLLRAPKGPQAGLCWHNSLLFPPFIIQFHFPDEAAFSDSEYIQRNNAQAVAAVIPRALQYMKLPYPELNVVCSDWQWLSGFTGKGLSLYHLSDSFNVRC